MIALSPITTPAKQVVCLCERVGRQVSDHARFVVSQLSPKFCCSHGEFQPRYVTVSFSRRSSNSSVTRSQSFQGLCRGSCFFKQKYNSDKFRAKSTGISSSSLGTKWLGISSQCQNINLRLLLPKHDMITKIRWNTGFGSRLQGGASAATVLGLSVCFSCSEPAFCEASREENNRNDDFDSSSVKSTHGKKVYTNYSITGIPGDGRCLFRSVAHGACLRSGKPIPSESLQKQLADDLREKVADEFVKRREETEWFVEGDFDQYVSHMRKPYVWGGEPELFMASHVLQMPITVYMHDEKAGGLISIAEYGQEYGKDDPIRVLYHGFGHYDALQIPGKGGAKSRL